MKAYLLKCVILLILINNFTIANAQTAEQLVVFTDKLFETGDYETVIINYDRVSFFKTEILLEKDYLQWAEACLQLKLYDQVDPLLRQAANKADNSERSIEILVKLAIYQMSRQEYSEAKITLYGINEVEIKMPESLFLYKKLLALCQISENEFIESKKLLTEILPNKSQKIDSLLNKVRKINKRYKPQKAKTLNMILPGMGFWYAGQFWKGINSFGLTAGILAVGAVYTKYLSFIDSLLAISSPLQRYYKGGYQKAEAITELKLREERNKIALEILRL